MSELWNNEINQTLLIIEQQSYDLSIGLLSSEKKALRAKGLEFIQDIYMELWLLILNCDRKKK